MAGQDVLHGRARRVGRGEQRLDAVARPKRDFGHFTHELLELIVLGEEISFGVHLNDSAAIALHGTDPESLGSGAASLFGGGGESLRAQPVEPGLTSPAGFTTHLHTVPHATPRTPP